MIIAGIRKPPVAYGSCDESTPICNEGFAAKWDQPTKQQGNPPSHAQVPSDSRLGLRQELQDFALTQSELPGQRAERPEMAVPTPMRQMERAENPYGRTGLFVCFFLEPAVEKMIEATMADTGGGNIKQNWTSRNQQFDI